MDKAIYLAANGAVQDLQALQLRANNLANASTIGFRKDLEEARSMQAYGDGLPTRVFAMVERPSYSFEEGSVITTDRDLDVAIKGDGWISILDNSGAEGLTRVGNLHIDQVGMLKNIHGHRILGELSTPILIPLPIEKIEIASDGTISVLPQGAPPEEMEIIDRIKLVRPDNNALFKDNNGVFKPIEQGAQFEADAAVKLLTGAVEGSNVNAVAEMTGLIDLQRQFEILIKLMKQAEEMDQASNSLLQMG